MWVIAGDVAINMDCVKCVFMQDDTLVFEYTDGRVTQVKFGASLIPKYKQLLGALKVDTDLEGELYAGENE